MTGACRYAWLDSPIGPLLAATLGSGLAWLSYVTPGRGDPVGELGHRAGTAPVEDARALREVAGQLGEYFDGGRREFAFPLDWSVGPTGFAAQALKVTATIPYGEAMSYGEVAAEAGSPGAARAVGNAMRANAIAIVVPCHRVLAAGGRIGGYMGGEANGLSIKRHLLDLERCAYRP
jgi:methylated-DNA-[protein]-cysteine S-methyltransferase